MPNPSTTETPPQTLIDIELPTAPELSWIHNNEWLLAGGLLLLCLALLTLLILKRSPHYQRMQLHKKLTRITPKNPENTEEPIPRQNAYLLYQYFLELQKISPPSAKYQTLKTQLNALCFAKEPVSRETYLKLLTQTKQLLKAI